MSRHARLVRFAILITCLLIGALAVGCATDRQVVAQANSMNDGLKPAVMEDQQLNGYLQAIGDRIIAAARYYDQQHVGPESHFKEDSAWMFSRNMQFHFVNSEQLNAFTTGGEHMYIYNKLFQSVRSEDELAAVMAHEYAHVYCRHVHKGINRQLAMTGGAAAVGAAGSAAGGQEQSGYGQTFASAAMVAANFIGMGFTRSDEGQADQYGFDFYTRAGWDPRHFGDFFEQMIKLGFDKTPAMLSDHPTLASRKEAADKRAAALPPASRELRRPPIASPRELRDLQTRAADLGKRMPSDKQLAGAQKILAALPRSCWMPVTPPDEKQAQDDLQRHAAGARKAEETRGK